MSIFRWLPVLDDAMLAGKEWLDAAVTFRTESFANALYELSQDKVAPNFGGVAQAVKGHNHTSLADGGYGGRPIARNTIFDAGMGRNGLWKVSVGAGEAGVWIPADRNATFSRTGSSIAQIRAPISPGMTSPAGSPPANGPYLDAWVYVYWTRSPGSNVDLRLTNTTTGATSLVVTTTATLFSGWIRCTQIPCSGGVYNDFELEIRASQASFDIYVNKVTMSESILVGAEEVCIAASSGSQML